MLILVLCRPAEDADQAEFRRLVAAETAALRELKDDGALSGAWNPGHPGAVLMLDVPGEAEAARLTARLPLAQAGLITTEIIPLHPIDLLPARIECPVCDLRADDRGGLRVPRRGGHGAAWLGRDALVVQVRRPPSSRACHARPVG